jgi:collagenase-like PrtC family protease
MHRQPIFLPESLLPELSVAAASRDQFRVAVRFAADSVILPRDWPKELYETEIRFAHENNVRVYLDLSGPMSQSEIQNIKDELAAYAYYAFDGLWISDEGLLGYVSYVTPSFKIFYQPLRPLSNFSQIVFWQNQGAERLLLSPPLIYSEIATFQKNSRIPLELLIYQDSLDLFAELKIIKETGVKSLRLDLKTLSIDLFAVQIKKFRQAVDELYLVQNLFDFENE